MSNSTANRVPMNPFKRGKRHDYFTSSLPWPQKGDALELSADVKTVANIGQTPGVYSTVGLDHYQLDADAATVDVSATTTNAEAYKMFTNPTINELRLAFQTHGS